MDTWFEDFFADEWLYVQRTLHDPVATEHTADAIVSLLELEPGMRVLDAPCGAGRVTVPLARRGLDMVGVDQTGPLLEDARRAGEAAGVDVRFEQRDMRVLDDLGRFDAAINVWGSWGYFDDAGNEAFAKAVATALLSGGRLLIDVPGLETLLPRFQPRSWMEVGDAHVLEDRHYDLKTGRVHVDWTIRRGEAVFKKPSSIRIYSFPELRAVLLAAGFSEVDVHGSIDGDPFELGKRMVVVATR